MNIDELLSLTEKYRVTARPFYNGGWVALTSWDAEIISNNEEWWDGDNRVFKTVYDSFIEALEAAVQWEIEHE